MTSLKILLGKSRGNLIILWHSPDPYWKITPSKVHPLATVSPGQQQPGESVTSQPHTLTPHVPAKSHHTTLCLKTNFAFASLASKPLWLVALKTRATFLTNQKQNLNQSYLAGKAFSRALRWLNVFPSNSDWLIALFACVVTGQSINFGFGFTTVNWKPF